MLRSGQRRNPHFFHPRSYNGKTNCRQSNKTLFHLRVQERLAQLLDARVEQPFPEINRIADIYWPKEKLIFEVQVSPIRSSEIAARNQDYASMGLEVVWLLHTRRFNKRYLSEAEIFLSNPYYTDIDAKGRGLIFDQVIKARHGKIYWRSHRMPIDVTQPRHPGFSGDRKDHKIHPPLPRVEWRHLFRGIYYLLLEAVGGRNL